MNVLVLTPWFPDEPNEQQGNFVLDSIESLCALGHRVHVLVTRPIRPAILTGEGLRARAAIKPEMFLRGFSLQLVSYLSIPNNYLRVVSNQLYLMGCAGAVRLTLDHKSGIAGFE